MDGRAVRVENVGNANVLIVFFVKMKRKKIRVDWQKIAISLNTGLEIMGVSGVIDKLVDAQIKIQEDEESIK